MKLPVLTVLIVSISTPSLATPIAIQSPWLRESAGAATTGAGYAVIRNNGTKPDRLVGARTAAADRVEIHSVIMDGGMMRMRPLHDGLDIPARGGVTLRPGSYHLMLVGLKRPLRRGETIAVELRFASSKAVTVRFPVQPLDHAKADPGHGGH